MSASSSASIASKVAVIIGVGPGLGSSVARRFAKGGYSCALLSRSLANLTPVQEQITSAGGKAISLPTDASDFTAVKNSFDQIKTQLGNPSVLIFNAGAFSPGKILDIDPVKFADLFKIGTASLLVAAQQVLPAMVEAKSGTILVTGATASLRGGAGFAGLAAPKFALRALTQSMAREFHPQGIHVAHFIIDGQIGTPRQRAGQPNKDPDSFLDSDAIAEQYWQVHSQDKTVWAQEMDLRPAVEKF